jgi:hypothetical protein
MKTSWLYEQEPGWIVVVLLMAMTVSAEIGCTLGRRWQRRADEARRGHLSAVLGSLLGLLALLLSFTFAMSAARYDIRRQLVIADANVLSGLYLQSSLLPEAARRPFKQTLREYVDYRTGIALTHHKGSVAQLATLAVRAEALHGQMWQEVKSTAEGEPPAKIADTMLKGLIEALAIHRDRLFAYESRVPDPVIWLLLVGALTAMTVIGLAGGLGNHRGHPARIALSILLSGTIYVLLDLDRPQQGLIRVSQTPMRHLEQLLDRDPELQP